MAKKRVDPEDERLGSRLELETENGTKYGKPKQFDPDFCGPLRNRSCTDIVCLILLALFLAGWGVISYWAFANGNADRLIYPTDSRGNICGRTTNFTDKPYLLYFDVRKCIRPQLLALQACPTPSVCVSECPTYFWSPASPSGVVINGTEIKAICVDDLSPNTPGAICTDFIVPSRAVAGRCIPNFDSETQMPMPAELQDSVKNGTKALGKYLHAGDIAEKIFQDFRASWWMILTGFLIAMIISFIWIVIMRWIAGPMVWLGSAAVVGLLGYGAFYCFTRWSELKGLQNGAEDAPFEFTLDPDDYLRRQGTWLAFGIIAASVLAIILLILLFLRNRIRLAIALLQEASKGVSTMMFSLLWPLVPFVLQVIVFGFWGILAVLFSAAGEGAGKRIENGTLSNKPCTLGQNGSIDCIFTTYESPQMYTYFHLYNIFGLFWLSFFVVGVSDASLAGAFATYYWTRDKASNMPSFPLAGAVGRTFRYHLGSIAFGSLIIAIVRFIRYLLTELDRKLKQSQLGFARFLLKCCTCCLWCLESFLKFINKNAYIMMAIYGKNFCRSAKDAFSLLMRNIIRVVVLDKVADFLLFLGKLVIVSAIGVAAFFFFSGRIPGLEPWAPSLHYYSVPVTTVVIGSYFISSAFFGVYGMAVDTLFLCFLEDLERNNGTPNKPYFMSKNLMRILGKKNRKAPKDKKSKLASSDSL